MCALRRTTGTRFGQPTASNGRCALILCVLEYTSDKIRPSERLRRDRSVAVVRVDVHVRSVGLGAATVSARASGVLRVVGEFRQAERLEGRWVVHAYAAAVALAQPVPAADGIVGRTAPRLDRAVPLPASARPPHRGASIPRAPSAWRGGRRWRAGGSAAEWSRHGRSTPAGRPTRRATSGTRRFRAAFAAARGRPSCPCPWS